MLLGQFGDISTHAISVYLKLLAICKRKLITLYSMSAVLQPIIEDIKILVSYNYIRTCMCYLICVYFNMCISVY